MHMVRRPWYKPFSQLLRLLQNTMKLFATINLTIAMIPISVLGRKKEAARYLRLSALLGVHWSYLFSSIISNYQQKSFQTDSAKGRNARSIYGRARPFFSLLVSRVQRLTTSTQPTLTEVGRGRRYHETRISPNLEDLGQPTIVLSHQPIVPPVQWGVYDESLLHHIDFPEKGQNVIAHLGIQGRSRCGLRLS